MQAAPTMTSLQVVSEDFMSVCVCMFSEGTALNLRGLRQERIQIPILDTC